MESQPQNPEFRNNPEKFHPYSLPTVSFPPSSLMPWTGNGLAGAVLLQKRKRPELEH